MAWELIRRFVKSSTDDEPGSPPSTLPSGPREHGFGRSVPRGSIDDAAPPFGFSEIAEENISRAAAESQRQAKSADDTRKAEHKAHVERAVPPMTGDGSAALRKAQDSTLAIRHVFPPRLPQRSLSFLGGEPVVPDDFDWPMLHNRGGLLERLTFMAQIDCADIPAGPARHLLPKRGYLYFFAPMSQNFGPDAHHFVTRYLAGPARKSWEPSTFLGVGPIADVPDDLAAYRQSKERYGKVEIEFGWLEEPTDEEIEARRDRGLPHEIAQNIREERASAFLGPERPGERRLSFPNGGDVEWLLNEGFPNNRAMARTLRERITSYCSASRKALDERRSSLAPAPEDDPAMVAIAERRKALENLEDRSSRAFAGTDWNRRNCVPPLTNEEGECARAFLNALLTMGLGLAPTDRDLWKDRQIVHGWMAQAAIVGVNANLTQEASPGAARVPQAMIDAVGRRHDARNHHLFGNGTVVQVAADEMKDRNILLLQLGADSEMDWLVGEMGPLRYWITPEDLTALRLENTVLTMEAH